MKKTSLLLLLVPLLFACDSGARTQMLALAKADSLRQDSLLNIKNQLLSDMLVSTQFINDINAEIAKARSLPRPKAGTALATPVEAAAIQADRDDVLTKIKTVVARLNASDSRLARLRTQAASLSARDSTLMKQVAQYEQTIADFRQTVENQKQEFQAIFDRQNAQIASLRGQVDTLTSSQLALTDSVGRLETRQHTGYYVAGTQADLVRDQVLAEEGHRRFWLFGGRTVVPARTLDTTAFTRINIMADTAISLPDGEYAILSRQDPQYAQAFAVKDGNITGGLHITDPEAFWSNSKFLILVKQ